ncbi:RagB/SusD family nutrient uptake outer membrane protein [Fulvivirga ligni]|uniref:RagB/SusD family nutrient uptake outer membrane protein n=1 Tax=Fulvivirga ligni TaxID=2904246 RepID=UPI001F369AD6|nr:RagB/SusD family nutrient uptake outer membrane protein [Fulvivirga ligni]UII20684.1 RagB/SusD family nutrient uptake outer membrane protein [Fulvivirga ligni]
MKLKYNIILLLAGLFTISSCDLTEEPYGFYSENNFYKTPADAEAAINYAYDALTYLEYSRAIFFVGDMPTDECSTKSDEAVDNVNLATWKTQNFSTNTMLKNFFKYAYIAINRSNAVLEYVPQASFSQSLKDPYIGQAYFLRAWNYFNLARNFGRVPIHKNVIATLDQTSAPMAQDLSEVYDLILSDCRKAIELLPVDQVPGHADKVAAQALAAKVYLFMASSKDHGVPQYSTLSQDVNQMYDSAAFFSGQVINDQGQYGFDSDLLNIYDVNEADGPEHIFIMSMDRGGLIEGDYSKISKLFIPYVSGSSIYLPDGDGTYTVSHDGWSVMQTNESFYSSFDGSDKRAQVLLVDSVFNEDGEVIATYPDGLPYRFSRKYIDPEFVGDKTSTKPYLIRYTDIALTYAEAVGPTAEAYNLVNYVRNRAGLGNMQNGLSAPEFRERILEERKHEFAFEGNRLYDLRRFNRITTDVESAAGLSAEDVAFYPIPQTEIDLNQEL